MPMNTLLWLTAALALLVIVFVLYGRRSRQQRLATIEVVTIPDVAATALGNTRDVLVYLPPDYDAQAPRTYPVLYVNDGQDREQFKLRETLARMIARREMQPTIVVAVPTNGQRLHEYGTAIAPNSQGLGELAPAFTDFFVRELVPLINANFRTRGPALICGVSLGGLSAFDLHWNFPDLFGTVGVFSGSFWWRAAEDETAVPPGQLIAHEMVRRGPWRPGQRFWFEAGTRDEVDDRDGNGVIDAIQDTTELVDELVALGYARGEDVVYFEAEGGRHNYETWSEVLPVFLRWALGPGSVRARGAA